MHIKKYLIASTLVLLACSELPAQFRRVVSPNPIEWSFFGDAVSIYGNHAFIGEPRWHSGFGASEKVHFYKIKGGNWKRTQTITTPVSVWSGFLGRKSGMTENWVVFSQQTPTAFKIHLYERVQDTFLLRQTLNAPDSWDDGTHSEVIGINDEHLVFGGKGSLIFYRLADSVWIPATTITKPGTEFGHNSALHGNRAVACDETHDVAFVFEFDGSAWHETATIHPPGQPTQNHVFGENCALYKDILTISDFSWQTNTVQDTTTVFLYKWVDGAVPQLIQTLKTPTLMRNSGFGTAFAFTDDYMFIGSLFDEDAMSGGRVFKYRRSGDFFELLHKYSFGNDGGDCLAVSGNQLMVGEPDYNSRAGAVWIGPVLDTLYLAHDCVLPDTINGNLVSEDNFHEIFRSDTSAQVQGAPQQFGMALMDDFFQETHEFIFCFNTPEPPAPQPIDVFGPPVLMLPPDCTVEWSTEFEHNGQLYTAADLLDDVHSLRPVLVNPLAGDLLLTLNFGKVGDDVPCGSWPVWVRTSRYFCSADTVHLTVNAGDTLMLSPDCIFENDTLFRSAVWQSTAGQFSNPDAYETHFFSQTDANVWLVLSYYFNFDCFTQQNFSVKVLTVDAGEPRLPSPGIRVFPNPGGDFLNIELPDSQFISLRLCAADGRQLRQVSGEAQRFRLDVSKLPTGIYTLSSNTGWITKWVKLGDGY